MTMYRKAPIFRALILCLGVALAGCAPHFEKPALSVARVEFAGGSLLQQNFQVTFSIHNPNHRTLPVSGLHAELLVDGDPIATGASDRAFLVPADADSTFDMTIHADMALGLLKLARRPDSLKYEVRGEVSIDLPFLRSLPFRQSGALALGGASR